MIHALDAKEITKRALADNERYEQLKAAISDAIEEAAHDGMSHVYIPLCVNAPDWLITELREQHGYDVHVNYSLYHNIDSIVISW